MVDLGEDASVPVHALLHTVGSSYELNHAARAQIPEEEREHLDGRIRDAPLESGVPRLARQALAAKA